MADDVTLDGAKRRAHWDTAYAGLAPTRLSWYQPDPAVSLELIENLDLPRTGAVIDAGGGASTLVDGLLARGFSDLSVLDISEAALDLARARLKDSERVHWLREDVVLWQPSRRYDVWHDRAVFHFLVDEDDRNRYLSVLQSAVKPGGYAVLATFAPDGPDRCSGLPVARYAPADLAQLLDGSFEVVIVRREEHVTPAGVVQPFTWVVARASGEGPGDLARFG